jgi:hypothetical protein
MDFLTVKLFFKEYTVAEDITVVKKISFTSKEVDPFIYMEQGLNQARKGPQWQFLPGIRLSEFSVSSRQNYKHVWLTVYMSL